MKSLVSPAKGRTSPVSAAADFEEAQAGRAEGDDAAAGAPGRGDALGGRGRKDAPFAVHMMLARVVGLDRQKGAGADMQGQAREADAASRQCLDQRRGEMQAGGGRGDGTLGAGEDRLVIGAVARVAAARRA